MHRTTGFTNLLENSRKLLVLDLDNTLCDFSHGKKDYYKIGCARPFLHDFLSLVDKYYDIIIWSATDYGTLQGKLQRLGVARSKGYKYLKCLDITQMTDFMTICGKIQVKSLHTLWKKYPQFNKTNTIIIDDHFLNFCQTPDNGLQIKPYFNDMVFSDNELYLLGTYLTRLATYSTDFSKENHKLWKKYNPK